MRKLIEKIRVQDLDEPDDKWMGRVAHDMNKASASSDQSKRYFETRKINKGLGNIMDTLNHVSSAMDVLERYVDPRFKDVDRKLGDALRVLNKVTTDIINKK